MVRHHFPFYNNRTNFFMFQQPDLHIILQVNIPFTTFVFKKYSYRMLYVHMFVKTTFMPTMVHFDCFSF